MDILLHICQYCYKPFDAEELAEHEENCPERKGCYSCNLSMQKKSCEHNTSRSNPEYFDEKNCEHWIPKDFKLIKRIVENKIWVCCG